MNGYSPLKTGSDDDFELMGDMPKEDPVIAEVKKNFSIDNIYLSN